MNQAHLHLVFNHFPIIIPFIGVLVMVGAYLVKSEILKRTAYALFILGALFTIPAYATGEEAEEIVEHLEGVEHDYIEAHEEAAETFALFSYLLGIVSMLGMWSNWKQKSFAKWIPIATIVVSMMVLYFGKIAGTTGGEIMHKEIREN
jgi:uncharacterized membrane protein